jgi:nucleoid DNA-binding protein
MAELKTKKTKASVSAFLDTIEDPQKRKDAKAIAKMMKAATGAAPKMRGTSIVGFGSYSYKYASGHEGQWPLTGFSPRKQNLSL